MERAPLFLPGRKVNEAVTSPCRAIYYRSLTSHSNFLNKNKLSGIISLTRMFGRNVRCYLFIQKSAKQEASSGFEGPPAGKMSDPVILRIKALLSVGGKT